MSKTEGNDSIHDLSGEFNHEGTPIFQELGLTKREYFAAMAMQGFLTSLSDHNPKYTCAKWAVEAADCLIEELNK